MYNWLVFLHIAFAFFFMLAHGVHAAVMLKFRGESDPERALTFFNVLPELTLVRWLALLLGIPAFAAAYFSGWLAKGWVWVSLAIFLLISFVMVRFGAGYYKIVFNAANHAVKARKSNTDASAALEDYNKVRISPYPIIVASVGLFGLIIILWLMRFKPF